MERELPNIFTKRETSFFLPKQAAGMLNLYKMSPQPDGREEGIWYRFQLF